MAYHRIPDTSVPAHSYTQREGITSGLEEIHTIARAQIPG